MTKLQPEQEALLAALCEASRRARKDTFVAVRTLGGESLQHAGIEGSLPEWTWNDLEVLARSGMLLVTERQKNALGFVVAPAGFDNVAKERPKLRPSQVELLDRLCQAAGSKAGDFSVTTAWQGAFIKHPGLPAPITDFAVSDLDELGAAGLIRRTRGTGSTRFFAITNKGWEHWEGLRSNTDAVGRTEDSVRRLLESAPSAGPYAEAFERWAAAEAMLWTATEEPAHLTALGTICRDALQRFADVFARSSQGHVSQEEPSKTITAWSARSLLCGGGCRTGTSSCWKRSRRTGGRSTAWCSGKSTRRRRVANRSTGKTRGSSSPRQRS